MIEGIHHVAVGVPDLEAALSFYLDGLGIKEVQRSSFSGSMPVVEAAIGIKEPSAQMDMLRGGNAHVELWQYDKPEPRGFRADPPDLSYPHFVLEVKDIRYEYERLLQEGMTFVGCTSPVLIRRDRCEPPVVLAGSSFQTGSGFSRASSTTASYSV